MVTTPVKIIIYLASAILIFLGLVFMISANLGLTYFFEGAAFIGVACLLLFLTRERKPMEIRQTVSVSGPVKAKEVRCPNCNAIVDPTDVEVIAGKPYVTCDYCQNKFELTEEPKW